MRYLRDSPRALRLLSPFPLLLFQKLNRILDGRTGSRGGGDISAIFSSDWLETGMKRPCNFKGRLGETGNCFKSHPFAFRVHLSAIRERGETVTWKAIVIMERDSPSAFTYLLQKSALPIERDDFPDSFQFCKVVYGLSCQGLREYNPSISFLMCRFV